MLFDAPNGKCFTNTSKLRCTLVAEKIARTKIYRQQMLTFNFLRINEKLITRFKTSIGDNFQPDPKRPKKVQQYENYIAAQNWRKTKQKLADSTFKLADLIKFALKLPEPNCTLPTLSKEKLLFPFQLGVRKFESLRR